MFLTMMPTPEEYWTTTVLGTADMTTWITSSSDQSWFLREKEQAIAVAIAMRIDRMPRNA